jgi:hypothetical protein
MKAPPLLLQLFMMGWKRNHFGLRTGFGRFDLFLSATLPPPPNIDAISSLTSGN